MERKFLKFYTSKKAVYRQNILTLPRNINMRIFQMKRILLFICILSACTIVSANGSNRQNDVPGRYLGDCNNDDNVDVTDITMMVNFILNGSPTATSSYMYDFDVYNTNKDATTEIDVSDVTALVNLILNGTLELIDSTPTELPIRPGIGAGTALSPKK